ncbi:MAG: hypothetical protein AAF266_14290 [Planctomycetota bacterium]
MPYPEADADETDRVPPAILEQLHHVQWELVQATSTYTVLEDIYPDDEGVIELLRRCSPVAFSTIYDALMERYILGISRLLDPPRTGRAKNLSLFGLADSLRKEDHIDLSDRIDSQLSKLTTAKAAVQSFRNQVLAHNDRSTNAILQSHPGVKYRQLSEIRTVGETVVNDVRSEFGVIHFCFDMLVGCDATGIVRSLKHLERFREVRDEARNFSVPCDDVRRRLLELPYV